MTSYKPLTLVTPSIMINTHTMITTVQLKTGFSFSCVPLLGHSALCRQKCVGLRMRSTLITNLTQVISNMRRLRETVVCVALIITVIII